MKKQKLFRRGAGTLMPVSSLPSSYGIGTFGVESYKFVDFLQGAGQKYWQVLPLGPTSYGDSPYQSFSAFAGNPYFIDLDLLKEDGLLEEEELLKTVCGENPEDIDYEALYKNRFQLLKLAYERSEFESEEEYPTFCEKNQVWLENYSLYMALKEEHDGKEWLEWSEKLRLRDPEALEQAKGFLKEKIGFWNFCQYQFYQQWNRLKAYANKKEIKIIGDIPIYVAMDSADTWSEPEVFYLDDDNKPIEVAGCPPDAFSATGQLWGNPLYRWDYQLETGFAWWKRRLAFTAALYDVVRVDHFRGLESYYTIPFGDLTAENGEWRQGPGKAFFEAVADSLGKTEWILEDLGYLTEKVHHLRHSTGAPGMKVLQFAFDSREESDYLPHNYDKNCVVYTGTHDNDTTAGWFLSAGKKDVAFAKKYLQIKRNADGNWAFIRAAYASTASLAIVPMQDFLGLGSCARINTPSTLGQNWRWRMKDNALEPDLALKIRELTKLYGR